MRKKVVQAEHRLALYLAEEHAILGQLYEELADQVGRQVKVANQGLGNVRHSVEERGFEVTPDSAESVVSPTKKRKLPNV